MKILITIDDARKYRQLAKQTNQDSFDGYIREVQENELTELLGDALVYDFMDYLENNWLNQAGAFTRDSDYQFTAVGIDLHLFVDYSLRINDNTFVIVKSATYGGADTIIIVEGYVLPTLITTLDYKTDNDYVKLLNGTKYVDGNDTVNYNGLRPFITWKFYAIYGTVGSLKYSDVGGMSISSDDFRNPTKAAISGGKSIALQNSAREENRISKYLNTESDLYPLWETKNDDKNILDTEFVII